MKPKAKRGGQPGNKNNLKHGFYSELLTKTEVARLNKIKDIDLDDETKLLRSIAYKIRESLSLTELSEEELKAVNTIANLIQVINTTQRTKLLARGGGGEIAQTIMEAIMSIDPYKEL